jgi:hypothetical protein
MAAQHSAGPEQDRGRATSGGTVEPVRFRADGAALAADLLAQRRTAALPFDFTGFGLPGGDPREVESRRGQGRS